MCRIGEDAEIKGAAHNTLLQITNFGFICSSLGAVQMGVAEQVAHKLIENHLSSCELNDALSLTEAAYNNCRFLITRREAALDSERLAVRVALVDADLFPVVVVSPKEIVDYFKAAHA